MPERHEHNKGDTIDSAEMTADVPAGTRDENDESEIEALKSREDARDSASETATTAPSRVLVAEALRFTVDLKPRKYATADQFNFPDASPVLDVEEPLEDTHAKHVGLLF